MNKTNIELVKNPDGTQGYTWNPIIGCLGGCEYCYARKLANTRLKDRYLANKHLAGRALYAPDAYNDPFNDPFYPRFWPERLDAPLKHKKPAGIFACDMSDLFGIGVPEEWTRKVLKVIDRCYYHRFYLLTKQPQNLAKFSPFPDNCWVGVTLTHEGQYGAGISVLMENIKASVKFISFEPLLGRIRGSVPVWCNWVIIGALTGFLEDIKKACMSTPKEMKPMPYGNKWTLQPPIEWVEEIVRAADNAGVKVFLKDSLRSLAASTNDNGWAYGVVSGKEDEYRQEMPDG